MPRLFMAKAYQINSSALSGLGQAAEICGKMSRSQFKCRIAMTTGPARATAAQAVDGE
jgi:hypothetical protein